MFVFQVLVETLLRSRANTEEGLSLATDLCQTFDVFHPDVWSQILRKLTSLRLWTQLESTLGVLDGRPEFWSTQGYLEAWSCLVERPFKAASKPLTPDQRRDCVGALERCLLRCPVPQNLNVVPKIKLYCEGLEISDLCCDQLALLV